MNVIRFFATGTSLMVIVLLILVGAASAGHDRGTNGRQAPVPSLSDFEEVVFIDRVLPFHGGPPPHEATAQDRSFHLISGGIAWPDSSTVRYSVSTAGCDDDCGGATGRVNAGFDAWEVSGVTFTRNNRSPDENPCTETANSVSWTPIDGAGGIVARTGVCFNPSTKEILGFEMQFDSGDTWTNSAEAGKFDIQGTAAHEAGHAFGLDHVNAPKSARLTMFPFISLADAGIRTLGCGDLLGINGAYGTSLTCDTVADD